MPRFVLTVQTGVFFYSTIACFLRISNRTTAMITDVSTNVSVTIPAAVPK